METSSKECLSTHEPFHVEIPSRDLKKKEDSHRAGYFTVVKSEPKKEMACQKGMDNKGVQTGHSLTLAYPECRIKNKVAVLSWNSLYGLSEGPSGVYVSNLARALANEDQEVHVFTRRREDQPANEKIDGTYYHRIHIDSNLPLLEGISRFGTRISERIKRIEFKEKPFNIVHCHDLQPAKAVQCLKNGIPRQIVLTLHTNNSIGELKKAGDIDRHLDLIERDLIERSHRLICLNRSIKQEVQNRFSFPEEKISVIPDGFNWEDFQAVKDQGEIKRRYAIGPVDPLILFVGTFNNVYSPDILVDAIPALLKNNPQARFLLVGDGELMWPIKVKAHYLYFEHAIRLVGHKEGRELHELFQAADIVVIPNKIEAGPYQLLAAWSAKRPVVATEAGGCGLIKNEENGILVYDNTSSIVWGVERLLFDWDMAHEIAQKGWKYIEKNYTWKAIAQRIKDLYQCDLPVMS